jgi:hypothetical protein
MTNSSLCSSQPLVQIFLSKKEIAAVFCQEQSAVPQHDKQFFVFISTSGSNFPQQKGNSCCFLPGTITCSSA